MGLDQFIYKRQPEYYTIKASLGNVERALEDAVTQYTTDNASIIAKLIEQFRNHVVSHISAPQRFVETTQSNAIHYIVRDPDSDSLAWSLFNCFTVFNFSLSTSEKRYILGKFQTTFDKLPSLDLSAELDKYESLEESLRNLETEVAYWRKYHDLNEYILTELDTKGIGGNCEDLPLSKSDFNDIHEFITCNGESPSQIDDILNSWDDTCTYVYHPWW